MKHFYERNIVEIKNEYTSFLCNIMAPLLYEGIKKIYDKSVEKSNEFIESSKVNPNIECHPVLKIFQIFLKGVKNINNQNIKAATNEIRNKSKCADFFDDLVKAVVKSYIILLTYNSS